MAETFADMARAAGLPAKGLYTVREVSEATGVAQSTLRAEMAAGRIPWVLPPERTRGRLIRPAWVDALIEGGTR